VTRTIDKVLSNNSPRMSVGIVGVRTQDYDGLFEVDGCSIKVQRPYFRKQGFPAFCLSSDHNTGWLMVVFRKFKATCLRNVPRLSVGKETLGLYIYHQF
jgi:hypothetical protein